ncbi:hypothetical protein B0T17DRAFT_19133 [Bombardia bombarda]|uniref:Uncharacterized protein n=1 Tax=Bombardia bombarda TaxID=252184 RepID=A0AA39XIV0_9PEZI|nr:hypothetical protein B0T17DRAFT_19133 [Bombardia bombarda]
MRDVFLFSYVFRKCPSLAVAGQSLCKSRRQAQQDGVTDWSVEVPECHHPASFRHQFFHSTSTEFVPVQHSTAQQKHSTVQQKHSKSTAKAQQKHSTAQQKHSTAQQKHTKSTPKAHHRTIAYSNIN